MSQTEITIKNAMSESATVYITLGATSGCVQNVGDIPFVTNVLSPLQGYFTLGTNDSVSYTPPAGTGINGNFSVNTPPLNCQTTEFPSGVNLAEFILNNSFQAGNPQETIDISGVAGTNALFEFTLSGGGAWNAGKAHQNVTNFANQSIGNNVKQVGVFPYGCDDCTASVSPPTCTSLPIGAPNPPVPQTDAICNVQRDASKAGGTVTITINGVVG